VILALIAAVGVFGIGAGAPPALEAISVHIFG